MKPAIFTYYNKAVESIFFDNIESLIRNSEPHTYSKIIICTEDDLPKALIAKLRRVMPSVRTYPNSLSQNLLDLANGQLFVNPLLLTAFSQYDQALVVFDSSVYVTSAITNSTFQNWFYQSHHGKISHQLFKITPNIQLYQSARAFMGSMKPSDPDSLNGFSYFIINCQLLATKYIVPEKLIFSNPKQEDVIKLNKLVAISTINPAAPPEKIREIIKTRAGLLSSQNPSRLSFITSKFYNYNDQLSSSEEFEDDGKTYMPSESSIAAATNDLTSALKKKGQSASSLPEDFLERSKPTESADSFRDSARVSVIMTNYNCEGLVERAMRSVLSQTYSNLELLVVDDCSSDSSLDIITRVANEDSRVRVFRNIKQRGTYWSKNSVLRKTTGSYITMIDSDDYDIETRLEKQLKPFRVPDIVCVTCLNDRKVSEHSNVSEKISLGYPSMMFRYSVFLELGYYDSTRFGADSEFYERVIAAYGRARIARVKEVLQICPRRTNGLTGVIPEMSAPRLEYVKNYTQWHKSTHDKYLDFPQKVRKFEIPKVASVAYTDLSNSVIVPTISTSTLPVIMCVWKRVEGFEKTIKQLNSQTHKDFKLFIWNNNSDLEDQFVKLLQTHATFKYEFYTSPNNIGGFGRFKYADKIRRTQGLIDYCVFIDDDQDFDSNLLSTFLSEARPNTILSQWGWEFTRLWYYGTDARRERLPGQTVHYAGTGGMIADMRVFNSNGLFDCPIDYWFVEDLWLSFYANHNLNFKLHKSAAIMKNGDDIHSLYRVVKDVKTPMLIDLVNNFGWNILPKTESSTSTTTTCAPAQVEPSAIPTDSPKRPAFVNLLSKIINRN